jgi:hypothetical protein
MSGDVFRPDPVWSRNMVAKIVSLSRVDPSLIVRVEINCGGGLYLGFVVLADGSKVRV